MLFRFFCFLCALFLVSCSKKEEARPPVTVEVFVVEKKTLPIALDFVGVCQSSHLVQIRSRVQGYLEEVSYEEGNFVERGKLLFRIDPREYKSKLAEVAASLEREKAILWSAEKAVERYKPLYEQKAASRKDFDDATAQALAQLATVNLYEAKLDEAELNLSYTEITSPISGLTTSSRYQQGTLITPGVNDLLTTVSVIDPIWVMVNVSDAYFLESAKQIAAGNLVVPKHFDFDVALTLADGSIYPYQGKVNFISPVLNPETGTLSARAIFKNPEALLKPGQFVRATITGAKRPNAIIVPQTAVLQGEKGRYVFVVSRGNRIERRDVKTGKWYEEFWIIESGLKEGEEVVSQGVNKVTDGMEVVIVGRPRKK